MFNNDSLNYDNYDLLYILFLLTKYHVCDYFNIYFTIVPTIKNITTYIFYVPIYNSVCMIVTNSLFLMLLPDAPTYQNYV